MLCVRTQVKTKIEQNQPEIVRNRPPSEFCGRSDVANPLTVSSVGRYTPWMKGEATKQLVNQAVEVISHSSCPSATAITIYYTASQEISIIENGKGPS